MKNIIHAKQAERSGKRTLPEQDPRIELAIVIINYKTPDMTIACVESALADIVGINAHIVVVDNHSADDSVDKLRQWLQSNTKELPITLVASDTNLGFSGGNNLGMSQVNAEFYMLLNSDTLVRPGALKAMLSTFETSHGIGMVSPRLEYEDGTGQISCFRFHTPISEFIDVASTGLLTTLLDNYNVPIALSDEISHPEWTSFACIMLRRVMIDAIGLMDENYFLYYEDSDYCKAARQGGWNIANNPSAHVVHFRGGSAELKHRKREKKRLPAYYFNSRSYYFHKHYGPIGLLMANLLWSLGRSISWTREKLQSDRPRATSDRQWLDIWRSQRPLNTTKSLIHD